MHAAPSTNVSRGLAGSAEVPVDRTDDAPKPDHSEDLRFEFGDAERRRTIELLTGINSSRKTYYPALKQKVAELELSNVQLDRSRERAERLSEELQRAVTRTSSVLAATRHISRHLGLQEVVRETLDILTGPLGYPWAAIHVFRELGTRELLAEAVSRSSFQVGDHVICLTELEFELGFIRARESGRVVRTECVAAQQAGFSLVFFPLVSGFHTLGVMSVVAEQTMSADLDVCEGVATSVALAIENAALYRRVVSQARTLDRTLEELASISQSLTMTTQGEEAFLEQLASTVRELTGARHVAVLVNLRVQVSQELPSLGEKEEIEVYRIVQEALVNVRKHAQAANVWIHLFATGGDLYAIVEDDGVGMTEEGDGGAGMSEEADGEVATGFGLANMRRRAAALGGTLTVESQAGEGTRIILEVPLAGTPRLALTPSP